MQYDMLFDLLCVVVIDGMGWWVVLGIDIYGKIGISQDSCDVLFVGFVGDLVVGVWVGNDDNMLLKGINGGIVFVQIWCDFMSSVILGV